MLHVPGDCGGEGGLGNSLALIFYALSGGCGWYDAVNVRSLCLSRVYGVSQPARHLFFLVDISVEVPQVYYLEKLQVVDHWPLGVACRRGLHRFAHL